MFRSSDHPSNGPRDFLPRGPATSPSSLGFSAQSSTSSSAFWRTSTSRRGGWKPRALKPGLRPPPKWVGQVPCPRHLWAGRNGRACSARCTRPPTRGKYISIIKGVPRVLQRDRSLALIPLQNPWSNTTFVFGQGLSPLSRWRLRICPLPLERGPVSTFLKVPLARLIGVSASGLSLLSGLLDGSTGVLDVARREY